MRTTLLKSIKQFVVNVMLVLIICVATSVAHAKHEDGYVTKVYIVPYQYFYGDSNEMEFYVPDFQATTKVLMSMYGNIFYLSGAGRAGSQFLTIRGSKSTYKLYNFVVERLNTDTNEIEDIVFKTEQEANQFCTDLQTVVPQGIDKRPYLIGIDDYPLSDTGSFWIITVPYWIAYDTGSEAPAKATDPAAKKYVTCRNVHDWIPNPNFKEENYATGIFYAELNAAKTEYKATCMPASASNYPPATFKLNVINGNRVWINETNGQIYNVNADELIDLYHFNKLLGSQYCPMSNCVGFDFCLKM